jgi:hypothetical protein
LVVLSTNVVRQTYDSQGFLGILAEPAGTNICIRSAEICNAAWVNSLSPACVPDAAVGPFGTTTMDRLTDNDPGFQEGRAQAIVTTSATQFTAFCYVKAGTATSAEIRLTGTGSSTGDCSQTISGLSTTSSSIVACTSPAAYAGTLASVQILIRVGANPADQGTLFVEGCDVKASAPYRTSHIPTVAGAVTRSADTGGDFNGLSISTAAGLSWAASVQHPSGSGGAVWAPSASVYQDALNRTQLYRANTNVQHCDIFTTSGVRSTSPVISAYVAGQTYRQACSYSGAGASSTISGYRDGVLTATSATGLTSGFTATTIVVGGLSPAALASDSGGIITRVCVDPNPSRCR